MSHHIIHLTILIRGKQFRAEYSNQGEVRALVPSNVHIMALTATATAMSPETVTKLLCMESPVVVFVSPHKNIVK